jgi:PadR family transcriptional regulator PadR
MSTHDEAPLGAFEEQVILAVMRTAGESYGMNVRYELESVTGREIAIGAVYSTLDRLEEKGLVSSRRSRADGKSRRTFGVTRSGAHALTDTKRMRDKLWRGVDLTPLYSPG